MKSRLACVRYLLVPMLLFYGLFSGGIRFLHKPGFVLGRHELNAKHHYEAGFAASRYLLSRAAEVEMICTGDSRVGTGINPAWITAVSSFNLSCGSQTIPLTKNVILDTLEKLRRHPDYLLIAVTPDYLSLSGTKDALTETDLQSYAEAEKFLAEGPVMRKLVHQFLPGVFYRDQVVTDLLAMTAMLKELPPTSLGGKPFNRPVTWQQYFRFNHPRQNEYGWWIDTMGPYVEGSYSASAGVRARLRSPYTPDADGLKNLIQTVRSRKIEPLLMEVPFHDSFYKVHDPGILVQVKDTLKMVSQDCDVLLLDVEFDTHDAANWYDGHHFSVVGAERLSKCVNKRLQELADAGKLGARRRVDK
jgi:hypothetical protein